MQTATMAQLLAVDSQVATIVLGLVLISAPAALADKQLVVMQAATWVLVFIMVVVDMQAAIIVVDMLVATIVLELVITARVVLTDRLLLVMQAASWVRVSIMVTVVVVDMLAAIAAVYMHVTTIMSVV